MRTCVPFVERTEFQDCYNDSLQLVALELGDALLPTASWATDKMDRYVGARIKALV